MRILLTGATGYIGKRLLPVLLENGHEVICCVRNKSVFTRFSNNPKVRVWEVDFLEQVDDPYAPVEIDVAYYLVHSLTADTERFNYLETLTALNFKDYLNRTTARQVVFLSGISNQPELSKHLKSRKNVESILQSGYFNTTVLRAGIIIGSGSASFELIRDIVEKMPIIPAPVFVLTKCQPIAIRNVIEYLVGVCNNEQTFNRTFDIGGSEILTYKEMILRFAQQKNLKRYLVALPYISKRLTAYMLNFFTSTSYYLTLNLINSMSIEVICKNNDLEKLLGIKPIDYNTAIALAFERIEQNLVMSSWKDALVSSARNTDLLHFIEVPVFGTYKDKRKIQIKNNSVEQVLENIWSIGGERGWYFWDFSWEIRGSIDKLIGGTGLRRGRTNQNSINIGDALDFWRVLIADKNRKRLLLYAEMKLPGEGWLEYRIDEENGNFYLTQSATFRPVGLWGRLYWVLLWPIHIIIFKGMITSIESFKTDAEIKPENKDVFRKITRLFE